MRLKQIKLVGFKSFVDATTVPFPQQMTAIVGPNGCGKSNIIDAVRWVLGESSAKNLRGDAMTDVIFNGSSARKPVFQASVELVFDNTEGRLEGSMADRNEISVKRLVTRDATNSYFLNGTKCRRRDITDIFLGTGLGPRSYAIIEQGTISRLIESKPQELRVFIEEAAGISKYKERRRETENRIRATRDNLERLADVRQELGQQIEKLHRQAEAAKRFKKLKSEERKLKAELTVLKWQKYNDKSQNYQAHIQKAQTELERLISEQRSKETDIVVSRQQVEDANAEISQLQQQKFQLASDISRLEQTVKHAKQLQQSLSSDLQRLTDSIRLGNERLVTEEQKREDVQLLIEELLPELDAIDEDYNATQQSLFALQNSQKEWQEVWQKHAAITAAHSEKVALNTNKLQSHLSMMSRTERQVETLTAKEKELTAKRVESDDEALTFELEELQLQQQLFEDERTVAQEQQKDCVDALRFAESQLNTLTISIKEKSAKLSVLKSMCVDSEWQNVQRDWLTTIEASSERTLATELTIESGWETAAELVLSHWLKANILNTMPDVQPVKLPAITRLVFDNKDDQNLLPSTSLATKVKGVGGVSGLLAQVLCAESDDEAIEIASTLPQGCSVISKQGLWLSGQWLVKGQDSQDKNLLLTQQQISSLEDELLIDEQQREVLHQSVEMAQTALVSAQDKVTSLQNSLLPVVQRESVVKQSLALKSQQQQQLLEQLDNVSSELALSKEQLEEETLIYEDLLIEKETLASSNLHENKDQAHLAEEKQQLDIQLSTAQSQLTTLSSQRQDIAIKLAEAKNTLQNQQSVIQRAKEQIEQFVEQQEELELKAQEVTLPIEDDNETLQMRLATLSEVEQNIQAIHERVASAQAQVKAFEQLHSSLINDIQKQRDIINENHLDAESYRVRAKSALEQLDEMNQSLKHVLADMPENASEDMWQHLIEKTSKSISRLGAINLAAIEEFDVQLERKTYLDNQNADLEEALATLESAIAKIDRESRAKFKATFEQVNGDLQTLFPKVFGGGSAYLELTGDDLLDTGVTIMARPPGKKNSTIHLLSGGEKALTALSLVFAIFRLNPAPFCMLDEVDAPLDDANVGRFCNLVSEMSQSVQFVYISHNKIAMEMATQLTGVTMHEPGVSRMVAVDIDEAIAMADLS